MFALQDLNFDHIRIKVNSVTSNGLELVSQNLISLVVKKPFTREDNELYRLITMWVGVNQYKQ